MTILQIVCLNLNFVTQFYMRNGHNLVLDALQIMSEGVTVVEHQLSNFSAISWREQVAFAEMMMMYALYQNNKLVGFLQCQITETAVRGQTCRSTRTYYSDSEPTNLCSYSLMLHTQWRSNKYKFYSLNVDMTGDRTYDLLHSFSIMPLFRFDMTVGYIEQQSVFNKWLPLIDATLLIQNKN